MHTYTLYPAYMNSLKTYGTVTYPLKVWNNAHTYKHISNTKTIFVSIKDTEAKDWGYSDLYSIALGQHNQKCYG